MSHVQIDTRIKDIHAEIATALEDVVFLTEQVRNDELKKTVEELSLRIDEPFMFVIVGEVKAGKSSFVNALLRSEKEIAKVAPEPCTDRIQQLKYADDPSEKVVNEHYVQLFQPFEILQEISIVDTPGTNTIMEHHQEITERFVPISDLIVFVFEAKNPYRQSSWAFFDFIHDEWKKKVIFVLQQKDLVDADALQTNIQGVAKYAAERQVMNPQIFAVSALEEKQGMPDSGFQELHQFIRQHITGGKAPVLKQKNLAEILHNVNARILQGLDDRKKQYRRDKEFREDITNDLDNQEERSHMQVTNLVDSLTSAYDKVALKTRTELREGMSFFILLSKSFKSMFDKQESPKVWLEGVKDNMEKELNAALRDKLSDGVSELADSIQSMAKIIELKLHTNTTILHDSHALYSHIAEKRKSVLNEVRESFQNFMSRSENFAGEELFETSKTMAPNIATGSGIAIVGIILSAVTNGMVFDITGGVLTTIGLMFAGITAGVRRKKIIERFDAEINKGKRNLNDELDTALTSYIKNIRERIESNFYEFDQMLEKEEASIVEIEKKHKKVGKALDNISTKLESLS